MRSHSRLKAQGSRLNDLLGLIARSALVLLFAMVFAISGMAQRIAFGTHDYTTTFGSPIDLDEAFADGKSPGNGLIYTYGSIQVVNTLACRLRHCCASTSTSRVPCQVRSDLRPASWSTVLRPGHRSSLRSCIGAFR